jgi:hypothetical protein
METGSILAFTALAGIIAAKAQVYTHHYGKHN